MIKILIVDDEKPICDLIDINLSAAGYDCKSVQDGLKAIDLIESETFDLILLDIMLPGADGYDIMEYIRPLKIPVIFITAKHEVKDRVKGLKLGAEDYLVKPFEFAELMARLRALGRRSSQKIQQDMMDLGDFTLDRTSKVLKKGEQVIQLSPREFQIFDLLVQNMGIVVPRDIILDRIWGLESEVSSNNIDSYVKLLRKKLESADGQMIISTIRGVGYKLEIK